MKKTIISVVVALVLVLALSSCSLLDEAVKNIIKGDVTGELNTSYSTQWFDFTVKSIKSGYTYGDCDADDGWKFVVVRVSETNTFSEPIPMGIFDFYLEAEGLAEEDSWPLSPLEGSEDTMMPDEFELDIDETAEYDVVFIIPDEITEISFIYEEYDEDGNIGVTFTINHTL